MNIQELQSERDALQKRLRSIIQSELDQFQNKTGVGVNSVSTYLVSFQAISGTKATYIINKVQVDLDI